jgi:hypothetical protein
MSARPPSRGETQRLARDPAHQGVMLLSARAAKNHRGADNRPVESPLARAPPPLAQDGAEVLAGPACIAAGGTHQDQAARATARQARSKCACGDVGHIDERAAASSASKSSQGRVRSPRRVRRR